VGIVLLLIYLVVIVLAIVGWYKILAKAGYSGWLALLALIPVVNFILFLVFAFSDWPHQRQSGGGYYGNPSGGIPQWSPSPQPGGYPPTAGGYPPSAPGNYPQPTPMPQAPPPPAPPPPFSGGTV
jgi:hypothetical protein